MFKVMKARGAASCRPLEINAEVSVYPASYRRDDENSPFQPVNESLSPDLLGSSRTDEANIQDSGSLLYL